MFLFVATVIIIFVAIIYQPKKYLYLHQYSSLFPMVHGFVLMVHDCFMHIFFTGFPTMSSWDLGILPMDKMY